MRVFHCTCFVPEGLARGWIFHPLHWRKNLVVGRAPRGNSSTLSKAIDITTTSVERYKALRLKDKVAPAMVNRELATLKRMFRLGLVEPDHLLQLGFEGII